MTKEEEILLAAEEEFFDNGYDACSTAAIAKRVGVTHAMVNYYFRSKEKLFVQILDNHVHELLHGLKPLMQVDGNVAKVAIEAACVIFDKLNEDRRFPYLLSDISRAHPEFLLRYKDTFDTTCMDSIRKHADRLRICIEQGLVKECTMRDIYHTIFTLTATPFMMIPVMKNMFNLKEEQIEDYLRERREEMVKILTARYMA